MALIVFSKHYILLADKCLFPYYGGCPMVRECITSESGRRCGSCLPGLTGGLFGPCFGTFAQQLLVFTRLCTVVVLML